MRHEKGVSTAWELRYRGVRGASARRGSGVIAAATRLGRRVTAAWEGRATGVRGITAAWERSERGVSTAWGASSLRGSGITGAWNSLLVLVNAIGFVVVEVLFSSVVSLSTVVAVSRKIFSS